MNAYCHRPGMTTNARVLSAAIAEALRTASSPPRGFARGSLLPSLIAVSSGAILGSVLAMTPATPALGQEAAIEEITVTGSRIPRRDFVANSPITTIDQTTFEETSTIGVETVLNQLPHFVPAVTQFHTTDVQNTAINTVGASTVSLRGLGANRNLVLINGRRGQPVNPTMVVDTNSIPATAIERVEVISGGASAVYGADAVGGVVNFILREDFEGATIDTRFGSTQHGGHDTRTISGLIGANVIDGQGNVMLGVEYSDRTKVLQQERDWRLEDMAHPQIAGSAFFPTETWFLTQPQGAPPNPPSQEAVDALFAELDAGTIPASAFRNWFINRTLDGTGTVYTGIRGGFADAEGAPGTYRYEGPFEHPEFPGLPFRKFMPDGQITENTMYNWSSNPLERYSAFGRGVFEVTPNVRVNAQALFARTQTETSLGLTSDAIGVHGAFVPHGSGIYEPSLAPDGTTLPAYQEGGLFGLNCPPEGGCTNSEAFPLPPEVEALMASRPDPDGPVWLSRPLDFLRSALGQARGSRNQTSTFQLALGVEGQLPGRNHFWDVSYSQGWTDNTVNLGGAGRLEAWRTLVGSPNFGVGFSQQGNPAGGGFQAGIASCTTGLPVVRDFAPSDDCITMLTASLHNTTQTEQAVLEANLVGTLAEMRAGPLQYALGTTYRDAAFTYQTDSLTVNEAFIETVMGLFPTQNSSGSFNVRELYGELLIPIVSGGPTGIEHFNLELGGRVSDFSTVGTVETFKGLIDWAFTPRYRLRGGFNRAHRAPNLGELFMSRTQVFGAAPAIFADQCSQNNQIGPHSANPAVNVEGEAGAARTEQICRALMGPTGAATFYDDRPVTDQPDGISPGETGTGLPNTIGNPNVREERADTFTIGVVMDFLDAWTLTVDYYQIEIDDMIAVESPDAVFERCLNPAFNPDADPAHPACQALIRNPATGNPASVDLSFTNEGRARTSGVDVQLDWSQAFDFGGLAVNVLGSWNLENITQAQPGLPEVDWRGTLGCALQMQCMGYDYRVFTTFSYFNGPYAISLRAQHWPSIRAGAAATDPNTTAIGITSSYTLFSLSGNYRFGDRYTVRMGIENLFDRDPPRMGGNPLATPFPTLGTRAGGGLGAGTGATYDPLGRRAFVNLTMEF